MWRVHLPQLVPAFVTGSTPDFSRAVGEYGSVIFVSGYKPFESEIGPVLVVARLEEFAYAETVVVAISLVLTLATQYLHHWSASDAV